ncbi:MAG: hypothetical protein HYY43_04540 [Deltaproteobacteria bacterium]|nr:hypothetical protein [Deltaproteobacteria bacterium]MBI2341702.1 hypothetical protein [Deltaproteobacteria bacterium]MBI2974838.1 hypothetical protein [Deltaproteobacteria bacterium]
MLISEVDNLPKWNGREKPFYENYYLKVNIKGLDAALWLRYTFLSPIGGRPEASVWAAFFDAKNSKRNFAIKETVGIDEFAFYKTKFELNIGGAILNNCGAGGRLIKNGNDVSWNISWKARETSFKNLPFPLYYLPFPTTKVVAPNENVIADGFFTINGVKYEVHGEKLHQGHVWGKHYSKEWAWANCISFNEDEPAFLELLANRFFGLGFISTSAGSERLIVKGRYGLGFWEFEGFGLKFKIKGKIFSPIQNIIGVTYTDPDDSKRFCYNTTVADAVIDIYKRNKRLSSAKRAAFEIVNIAPSAEIPVIL